MVHTQFTICNPIGKPLRALGQNSLIRGNGSHTWYVGKRVHRVLSISLSHRIPFKSLGREFVWHWFCSLPFQFGTTEKTKTPFCFFCVKRNDFETRKQQSKWNHVCVTPILLTTIPRCFPHGKRKNINYFSSESAKTPFSLVKATTKIEIRRIQHLHKHTLSKLIFVGRNASMCYS